MNSARVPDSLRESYRAFMYAELYQLSMPAALGGSRRRTLLNWAVSELILGSKPAIWMFASRLLDGPCAVVLRYCGAEVRAKLAIDREGGVHHSADRAGRGLRRRGADDKAGSGSPFSRSMADTQRATDARR